MKISSIKVRLGSLPLGYSSLLITTAMLSTLFFLAAPTVYARPDCEGENPPPICDPDPEPLPAPAPAPAPPPAPAAPPAQVRVRIEPLEVWCGTTEDTGFLGSEDEFYTVGALHDGTNTKGVLTPLLDIDNNQTKPYNHVIFDADMLEGQTVRGGLKAFDEDTAKDWGKYSSDVTKITDMVASGLEQTVVAVPAGIILRLGVGAFDTIASSDEDDELGSLEMNRTSIWS